MMYALAVFLNRNKQVVSLLKLNPYLKIEDSFFLMEWI